MDKNLALVGIVVLFALVGGGTWYAMNGTQKTAAVPAKQVQTTPPSVTPPEEQKAVVDEQQPGEGGEMYVINQEKSLVQWYGERVVGNKHTGTLKIASGKVMTKDGTITGGMFAIDMNSMAETTASGPGMVIKHLMSEDFFDTTKFPMSTFVITKVVAGKDKDQYDVTGKLTIKGNEHEITFPAMIAWNGDMMVMSKASFTFDRTKWDIRYGSGKFFQDLGDKLIKDDITMTLDLTAEKQK